jgi:hypothetical protein
MSGNEFVYLQYSRLLLVSACSFTALLRTAAIEHVKFRESARKRMSWRIPVKQNYGSDLFCSPWRHPQRVFAKSCYSKQCWWSFVRTTIFCELVWRQVMLSGLCEWCPLNWQNAVSVEFPRRKAPCLFCWMRRVGDPWCYPSDCAGSFAPKEISTCTLIGKLRQTPLVHSRNCSRPRCGKRVSQDRSGIDSPLSSKFVVVSPCLSDCWERRWVVSRRSSSVI